MNTNTIDVVKESVGHSNGHSFGSQSFIVIHLKYQITLTCEVLLQVSKI